MTTDYDGRLPCEMFSREWYADPVNVDACVEACKREIQYDIDSGLVPASVRSFSELHDYVDANLYGGGGEWPEEEWSTERFCAFWNRVQSAVEAWLKRGRDACPRG